MLLGTRIALVACVCCKCTSCKCIGGASKKRKPKAVTGAESSIPSPKPETPHDPSDEDETYHIRGARHIPKKVYKPILKPPRSRRDSRLGQFESNKQLVAVHHEGDLYASVESVALETMKLGKPVEHGKKHMEYIDAHVDEVVMRCRKKEAMKRGFRQLFSQERTSRTGDEEDTNGVETDRKRPARFFQKFFRPAGSYTSSPGESPRAFRRTSHADEDGYAEIKREMSVPVPPKSVKFQDEVPARRGQSAVPQTSAFSSRTTQQHTLDHQYTTTLTSSTTPISWRSHQSTTESVETRMDHQHSTASRDARGLAASQSVLDEATRELLQLSAQPTATASISYSNTARITPAADQLQKSASTSSMNKVIRTVDGGVLKLANVFTWDAARLRESPHPRPISPLERTFVNSDDNPHSTVLLYTNETRKGTPPVRTSVEGRLQMEKIVGADLVNIEQCVSTGWTIKDTVTHYKVKTKMGERTLVMEESRLPKGEEPANDFKMSIYERDKLKSEQKAEIKIPPNMSKSEYLAHLSERLLRDMEKLEQDENRRKTTTRIEIEVIEDVTKLLKTYIIGERAELQPQLEVELDQAAIDASDEFMSGQQRYEHASDEESSSPPIERVGREYIDMLESEIQKKIEPTDIRLEAKGQHFVGKSQLTKRAYAESEESSGSITVWRQEPRCANMFADCELNRTEDSSCNDVIVAETRAHSAQLTLIRERMVGTERRSATYDLQQQGKRFSGETTIRRENKLDLEPSVEETVETIAPAEGYEVEATAQAKGYKMEQEGEKFISEIRMHPIKKYESEDAEEASTRRQVTECELIRKEDSSLNSVVIAVPRTEEIKVLFKRSKMIQRQAKAAAYDLEQEGQRFEGETTIKRITHFDSAPSVEEPFNETGVPKVDEQVTGRVLKVEEQVREPVAGNYEMELLGQEFKGEGVIKRTRQFLSSESVEEEPGGGVTQVELTKKSSHGQFEATIVISNDIKPSSTRLRESAKTETASLVASFSRRQPNSLGQQIIWTNKNIWTDTYSGRQLAEEQSSVMIAIQKARRNEDAQYETGKNLSAGTNDHVAGKFRECIEEQAVAVCGLQCLATHSAAAQVVKAEKTVQQVRYSTNAAEEEDVHTKILIASSEVSAEEVCTQRPTVNCVSARHLCMEATSATTSIMVCLQNKAATTSVLSADQDDDARDEAMEEDSDENVTPRRIHVRVSEDTGTNTDEDRHDAGYHHIARSVADQMHMYSENLAEICYLIKGTRNEESANCAVVFATARKQRWRTVPVQSSTRIQITASSSSTQRIVSRQDVSDQCREKVKQTSTDTGEHISENTRMIHIIPIILGEIKGELQTERSAFGSDETARSSSVFQFRNVPVCQVHHLSNDLAYKSEATSSLRRVEERDDVASSGIWCPSLGQQGQAQILASTASENGSSVGSTTSASFERVDTSQDHRSHSTVVCEALNTTRSEDDSSIYEDISRSSTTSVANNNSVAYQMYPASNKEMTVADYSSRGHVLHVPIRREVAVRRARSISESGSDKTLTGERELANVAEHERSHLRTGWSSELSAARIAMMQAGIDLETVLLSTPASMFAESAIRRDLYNARRSLSAHRSISESDFTDDYRWADTGFYRSFEYRHQWSSERDIRAVAIEESHPRFLRSSSAAALERRVMAQDRFEDSTSVERKHLRDVYESDTTNFNHRQKLVNEEKRLNRLSLAKEKIGAERWQDESVVKIGRHVQSSETEQRELNLRHRNDFAAPSLRARSSAASQTENAFKEFGYITTIDTVIHFDQQEETIAERRRIEKAFLDEHMQSTETTKALTNVTIIPVDTTRDSATQTLAINYIETSGINERARHAFTVERIRPVSLSTKFAQTDDTRESLVSHQLEGIHFTHSTMQKSITEQTTEQSEELSHIKAQSDTVTRTRAISLRDQNLTAELISARGSVLETIDYPQYIQRTEEFAEVGKLETTKHTSEESRSFVIEEQHLEGMATKTNADAASCDIILKAAAQGDARREFVEYGDRRSSTSCLFQRVGHEEERESISRNLADSFTQQKALKTSASSSEQITKNVDMGRTPEIETTTKTIGEGKMMIESRSLQAATESMTTFEKAFKSDNETITTDVTINDKKHSKVCATHPEVGIEKKVLDAYWSTVIREAGAEKYLPTAITDQQRLETFASKEETAILDSTSVRTEEQSSVEQMWPLREGSSVEGRWAISEQTIDGSMQKLYNDETVQKSMAVKQHMEVKGRFLEQGEEESNIEGAFVRLERTQPTAAVEEKVKLQRNLVMSLETMHARDENTSEQLALEKERLSQLEQERTVRENRAMAISSTLQATTESAVTQTVGFHGKLEKTSSQEAIFSETKLEATSAKLIESSTEEKNYIGGWETIVREMHTENLLSDVPQIAEILTTSAAEEKTVQISSEVHKQQRSDFAIAVRPLCEKCADRRSFGIGEKHHETVLERAQVCATCEHIVYSHRHERDESTLREFGLVETEAAGFFSRIAPSRNNFERAETVIKMTRVWHELFRTDASKEEECTYEADLILAGDAELRNLFIKDVNRATTERLSTCASKDEALIYNTELVIPAAEGSITFAMTAKNRATVASKPLKQIDLAAKFVNALCVTVVNEEEIEVSVYDTFKEEVILSTEASKHSDVQTAELLQMGPLEQSTEFLVPITQFTTEQRRYGVSEECYEKLVECAQAKFEAENVFKDFVRGSSIARSLTESGEAKAIAGILLVRRTASKKSASADHVVNVSATLTQSLDTQSAKECFSNISLNLSLPSSTTEVRDTIVVSNAVDVELRTEYAKEESTAQNVGFTQRENASEQAESVLRASNRERMTQKMHESGSDAFDILSEWTTVYRDLEAEAALRHVLNVKRVVTILATTEESSQLTEEWTAREAVMGAEHSMPELIFNKCERSFAVENDWLRITLEKFAQSEGALKLRNDARRQLLSAKMRESGHEKLNAIINLQKVSMVRSLLNASECLWADRLTISAEPLRLKCEASESDVTAVEERLRRPSWQCSTDCIRLSAVTTQPVEFECEQAGNVKTKMIVDIRGKQTAYEAFEKTWPVANRTDGILLETEEYGEDKCSLFAQINSQQLTFADCDLRIAICRNYEPLGLITEASREEVALFTNQWEIRPQVEQLSYTIVIGNKGEGVLAKLNEPEEHLRTIGAQYLQDEQVLSAECRKVEARFGGEYNLTTKAPQEECRNTSLDLSRRSQVETLRTRLPQKSKLFAILSMNASTTETISSQFTYGNAPSSLEFTVCKVCSRSTEPVSGRFIETSEITHTIHAHFKTRESHSMLPVIVKMANFGGSLSLYTEYAEEIMFNGDYCIRKNECFTTTDGTLRGSNRAVGVILETTGAKESSTSYVENWVKESKHEETSILRRQANKGEHCALKMNECSDIKQSTYLQYSNEQQQLWCEETIEEGLFGGRFHLNTDASEEHERQISRELESDRQCIVHSSKRLIERITMREEVTIKASTLISSELTQNLVREIDDKVVAAILQDMNREQCTYSVTESEEEELTANAYYSKDSQQLIADHTVQLVRDGGSFMLSTKATTSEEDILDRWLEKDRLTESFLSYTVIMVNKELPLQLITKQSECEVSSISEQFHHDEQKGFASMSIRAANRGEPLERRLREISEYEQITHCQYKRADSLAATESTIWQKRYGGSLTLQTLASFDLLLTTTASLSSRRLSLEGAEVIIKTANRLGPTKFGSKSSAEENIEFSCSLNKSFSLQVVSQRFKTPNLEEALRSFIESTQVEETTNVQLERSEEKQPCTVVLAEQRSGGSMMLSTVFAQQEQSSLFEKITAQGRETTLFAAVTLRIANTTESPVLNTTHSSESVASCSLQLDKSPQLHHISHKRSAPNKGQLIIASMSECTSVQENTQFYYKKNAHVVHISEVFIEARYGGNVRLDTCVPEDNSVQCQMAIAATRVELISVETCRIEKNIASPLYLYAIAAGEQSAVADTQLQKSAAFYSCSRTWITSRRGDNQTVRIKESTEVGEYSNVQMRRQEFRTDVETMLKECRFGGRIELRTSYAELVDVFFTQGFMKQQAAIDVAVVRKAINRQQPIIQHYRASEESELELLCQLKSSKIRSADVSVLRSASNKESPVLMQTKQSIESLMAINVSMQRSLDEEMASCTVHEKRYGGGGHLACAAITEQYTGEIMLSFQKSSAFAHTSFGVLTANKSIPQLLKTNASIETTSNLQTSITSRSEQLGSASVCCALALFGGRIATKFMAAEETIFNAEVSYEKQHSEARFMQTRQETRQESPKMLQTAASQSVQIEVTETEVRRRLTEVHVESAVERASREITPVSLRTDYATETLIRTDEELCSLEHRHSAEVEAEQSVAVTESDRIVCTTPVHVELRHEEESREGLKEEKSEKRVSFAAEVTEKTLTMDMSMTVERREAPSIVKKPMKRESRGRRSAFKQNEAPNFVPVRRNSLLMALAMGSPHNIPHFRTLEDVIKGIKRAGLEYSNLIFGIDYTRSNYYQGEKTFDGKNLHDLSMDEMNPYQQVIEIVGKTLSSFDADGVIPAYGFGDEETTDQAIFNLYDKDDLDAECNGFEEVLKIYNEKTPFINMSGPTNFVPLIEKAVQIVRMKQSYHILVIVADGQVTNEKINQKAIAAASHYPLSIIMVGVGDGPWNMMTRFDETLPKRMFDNFHFVDFHKVMFNAPNQEASFALNALMEIPDQYKAIKELGLLKHSRRG